MAIIKQAMFSIVLVGRQNPQILNHEFLVRNDVLPKDEPFFRKDLKEGQNAFSEFFSTPPVAQIAYGKYALLVQEDRYQAMDATGQDPAQSPIIEITKRYFGKLLRYTPFLVGGLNLNCDVAFDDPAEDRKFDAFLGLDHGMARRAFDAEDVVASVTATFAFLQGRLSVVFLKPKEPGKPTKANFNYEFDYQKDIDGFLANLGDVAKLLAYRDSFYKRAGVLQ
jgi:hypothetical protein